MPVAPAAFSHSVTLIYSFLIIIIINDNNSYLLSHDVGSSLKALIGRRAEVAVPRKVEHGGAETDERLGNGGRQLSSVVVTCRHCTAISRHVKRANSLAETHGRDRCFTEICLGRYCE